MAITGKSSISLRKQDLLNQNSPAVGFRSLQFAHQATAGDLGFSLGALTTPTVMSGLGFVQPSATELAAANLQFYKKNLRLVSSARGALSVSLDYVVGGNSQITFSDDFGPALQDEIFVGVIDQVATSGNLIADTLFILETGTLSANSVDVPVGKSFKANYNASSQVGQVALLIDGQMLLRNVGNATADPSADGDYEEVASDSGDCNVLRLNESDLVNDRAYIVMSTGLSVVRGDGSVIEELENQQGVIDRVVTTLAAVAGVPEENFKGAPSNPQLKAFGDRFVTVENNYAHRGLSLPWTAPQPLVGYTDGVARPAGQIGETISQTRARAAQVTLTTNIVVNVTASPIVLTAGNWIISGAVGFNPNAATSITQETIAISLTSATLPSIQTYGVPSAGGEFTTPWNQAAATRGSDRVYTIPAYQIRLTATTTFYLVAVGTFTVNTLDAYGSFLAWRM